MPDEIQNSGSNFGTVARIIELLEPLNVNEREHVLHTVATWFRVGLPSSAQSTEFSTQQVIASQTSPQHLADEEKFSGRPVLSAKEFIFEKEPQNEAERLACLAYYLTHYQETPHFKNIDLSRLNTEAAQRKLSNPAVAAGNAVREGFFVDAPKSGYKQLSAMGERFVQLLPNREAAHQVKQRMAARRSRRNSRPADLEGAELEDQPVQE